MATYLHQFALGVQKILGAIWDKFALYLASLFEYLMPELHFLKKAQYLKPNYKMYGKFNAHFRWDMNQ